MKYTGIIRRLDSLGRIVIPREYRKMNKINESDPLEIIALDNGEILIKKVDLSAELISASKQIISELVEQTGKTIMLSDTEKFLAGHGEESSTLTGTILSSKIQNLIDKRSSFIGEGKDMGVDGNYACIAPVYLEDCFGALYILSDSEISIEHQNLLKVLAKVLGGMIQKY